MGLESAEKPSKALQEKFILACKQIARDRQPFSQVVKELTEAVPDPSQIAEEDLVLLYNDLKSMAELEDVLQGLSGEEDFIHSLPLWNQLRKRSINLLSNPPDFINEEDPQLVQELQERMLDLQKRATQASSGSINALARDVDHGTQVNLRSFDPYALLGKYWQLYWCLVSEIILDTSVQTSALYAIGKAQKMPRPLAVELGQKFEAIDSIEDIEEIEAYLNSLRFLNRGLIYMPEISDDGTPLRDLPPLPPGQTYPDVEPELDEDALESWHRVMINWLMMFKSLGQGEVKIKDLPSAAQSCKLIVESLDHLRKRVWPALKIPLWKSEDPLGLMDAEARLLLDLGASFEDGGLDWTNLKSMEIISYLDEKIEKLGLDQESTRIPGLFLPFHTVLLDVASDVREGAVDRIDRQVINILRDRSKPIKRLQDELLKKPQTDETAGYVYQAIIHTAGEFARDGIQSGQRKDAIAVWKLIRDATRPWAGTGRRFKELSPEVNRLWRKLYRHAAWNAIKIRFTGRRREVLIPTSIFAALVLIAVGYVALNAIQAAQSTAGETVALATSTLNLPATMRYETSIARATERVATSTAFAIQVQESREARERTATADVVDQISATRTENLARASTATAHEIAFETAIQQAILDQTATATAQLYILRATYESILCRNNPGFQSYELSSTPELSPDPGTRYNVGTSPFTVTASWTITNTSECRWGYLGLEPLSDEYDVTYSFKRMDGEEFEIGPENTVAVSETIQIMVNFDPIQARSVVAEWVLVINNQRMSADPHMRINIRTWIIPVYPPTRTPTPEDEDEF